MHCTIFDVIMIQYNSFDPNPCPSHHVVLLSDSVTETIMNDGTCYRSIDKDDGLINSRGYRRKIVVHSYSSAAEQRELGSSA